MRAPTPGTALTFAGIAEALYKYEERAPASAQGRKSKTGQLCPPQRMGLSLSGTSRGLFRIVTARKRVVELG